ncbi:hypothetical protein CALVIDRAFT_68449 [Calocera viscosa TUFC12733]|uniref:F-box domain-containing protein n=1 Tax=Calocera viscosa (strain TUFC12733) TaxID=1330018 RepID=A0A167N962_CALVF|nr:hypothetical protein CALVIDRAFT_68449 [Calocera viscosa TUFC12733]
MLDAKVLRFHTSERWTGLEQVKAILRKTPALQHLELCANRDSPLISWEPILQAAEKQAPNLTTLIMRYVPTTFGQLVWSSLLNLEIRIHGEEHISGAHPVFEVFELLGRTPYLERLVLHDLAGTFGVIRTRPSLEFDNMEAESALQVLRGRSPPLFRLRVFHLSTGTPTMASAYLILPSGSSLRELSISIRPLQWPELWNIEQLVAWPRLKVLSLPPPSDMRVIQVFQGLEDLEDLEYPRDAFLYLMALVSDGAKILPSLKTLRIRGRSFLRHDNESIVGFLRARESAGVPLQRLLIHENDLEDMLHYEPELRRVKVQIGKYRPRDGFEGVEAALEPVDVLLSESELRQYGPSGRDALDRILSEWSVYDL